MEAAHRRNVHQAGGFQVPGKFIGEFCPLPEKNCTQQTGGRLGKMFFDQSESPGSECSGGAGPFLQQGLFHLAGDLKTAGSNEKSAMNVPGGEKFPVVKTTGQRGRLHWRKVSLHQHPVSGLERVAVMKCAFHLKPDGKRLPLIL